MSGPRTCDNWKYKIVPCPTRGEGLKEFWNTMTRFGPWAYLCKHCMKHFGYAGGSTYFVWVEAEQEYRKVRRVA
jgi:hypothetical protein